MHFNEIAPVRARNIKLSSAANHSAAAAVWCSSCCTIRLHYFKIQSSLSFLPHDLVNSMNLCLSHCSISLSAEYLYSYIYIYALYIIYTASGHPKVVVHERVIDPFPQLRT